MAHSDFLYSQTSGQKMISIVDQTAAVRNLVSNGNYVYLAKKSALKVTCTYQGIGWYKYKTKWYNQTVKFFLWSNYYTTLATHKYEFDMEVTVTGTKELPTLTAVYTITPDQLETLVNTGVTTWYVHMEAYGKDGSTWGIWTSETESATYNIKVASYTPPAINSFAVFRGTSGVASKASTSVTYSVAGTAGQAGSAFTWNSPTTTFTLSYANTTTDTGSITVGTATASTPLSVTGANISREFGRYNSYDFTLTAADSITSVKSTITVPVATAIMNANAAKTGISFGSYAESNLVGIRFSSGFPVIFDGGIKQLGKLIWENSDTTVSYPATTVTQWGGQNIDLSNNFMIIIEFRASTSDTEAGRRMSTAIGLVGSECDLTLNEQNSQYGNSRRVVVGTVSIQFKDCYRNDSVANTRCIPYRVWAI